MKRRIVLALLTVCLLMGCKNQNKINQKFTVVTTTTMVSDLVKIVGGNAIDVQAMMGAGVDPHLYKASAGDVSKFQQADVIIYNGLHLEGKLVEVLEKMNGLGKNTFALGDVLPKQSIINSDAFENTHDPHIWFSIENWILITQGLVEKLTELNSENAKVFKENGKIYIEQLRQLKQKIQKQINVLPVEKRILVTAHDAFAYFGREFNFKVVGLQGISTVSEAGVKDVQRLANFIIEHQIKAIFVESSVPKRTIKALQAAVKSKGFNVSVGGELFSDALGSKETLEGTYIGMYKYNVTTIVNALKE